MKKVLFLPLFLLFSLFAHSQLTNVKFMIEIDDATGDYNCNMVIIDGSATTYPQRSQFNTQFTIVVPTGTTFNYIESVNPLLDNQDLMGTEPVDWLQAQAAISPSEQPESDFYPFSPDLTNVSSYSELSPGDAVTLFRVSADVSCNLDIRPIDNALDATIINSEDYSNGCTIGGTTQLYSGNELPSSSAADYLISDASFINCIGECVTISPEIVCAPPGLTYSWDTGETTPSITVCTDDPQVYQVTVNGPNGLSATVNIDVEISDNEIVSDFDLLCVGQTINIFPEVGEWTSDDYAVIVVTNDGFATGISEGTATLTNINEAGCAAEITFTVYPNPVVSITGPSEICPGGTTTLAPSTGGTWSSSNNLIATITSNGVVTGIEPGVVELTYFDDAYGCSSSIAVTVLAPPIITNLGSDELCAGQTAQFIADEIEGDWVVSNENIATIDDTGILTALTPGIVQVLFTSSENNCSSNPYSITVSNVITPTLESTLICVGETTNIYPSIGGTWASADDNIATVANDGTITGVGAGCTVFVFTDVLTLCQSEQSATLCVQQDCSTLEAATCSEAQIICDMDELQGYVSTMPQEETGGNQPNPLCPDGGAPNNISWIGFVAPEGNYEITITPFGCTGATNTDEGIQAGVYESCNFSDAVFCDPNCSTDPISIDADVFVPGQEYFFFIDGCAGSYCQYEITINGDYLSQCDPDPCGDETSNQEWIYSPAGEFDGDYTIATYTTANHLDNNDDLAHLIFYDYVTGNVYLKENNSNGFLDNEILLFNNPDHYANGEYTLYVDDIDNNGLTDIILTESNILTTNGEIGDRLSVYQNQGDYVFVRRINEQVCGMQGPDNIIIRDFDNDNTKDIFYVCTDFLYGILWINSWDDTDLDEFNKQTFCSTYAGDFNQDGLQDIGLSDELVLINNGNRSFSEQSMIAYETGCENPRYFVEETSIILGHHFANIILNNSTLETDFCSDHYWGDNENEIFRAYVNSPDQQSIIVPQFTGMHALDPNEECTSYIDTGIEIPNVVARKNTKIDLTLNGCDDFLVIEGNQIFAWINPKQSTKILGTAFIDENENGLYDGDELPLRNVLVTIQPGDFSILTNDDGEYEFSVPPGTYTLTANVNEGEWIQSELTINNIQITEPCNEGFNFAFVPDPSPEESATISMVNTIARCDFETRFTITLENTGSELLNGVLIFTFDERTTYFSDDSPESMVSGNTVTVMVEDLVPFSPKTYKITVKMPSGSASLPMLDFNATLYNKFGDTIEEYGYSDQLRCSYDPNDKREFPDREGDDNLTLMDEDLEYTIRFQNNGNDTAFLVTIVDPLDPIIEPSSIRVMNSSHPVETCIEGTDLIFLFEDIFLVDSMTNYPASQGFVTFRCNAKEGAAERTPVRNTADIIFDSNAPIVTNQTLNTLVSELCSNVIITQEIEICDGETYQGYTESGTYQDVYELAYGCDSTVITILEVQGITQSQNTVDICEGESVFIGGQNITPTESTELIDTTYNAIGCISNITVIQINVSTREYSQTEFSVCEGDEIVINDETYIISESTEIIDTILGSDGCIAQVITSQITSIPTINQQIDTTICEGYDYNGLTEAGTYTIDSIDVSTGCQLIWTINLDVLPASDPLCTTTTSDLSETSVKVYPIPASEMIYYDSDRLWNTIQVMNTQGQIIARIIQPTSTKGMLDVSTYPSGVYMMIFSNEERNLTKRFVVR